MLPKLYELADSHEQIFQLLMDGEVPVEVLQDTLESIEAALEVKAENGIALLKIMESYCEGFKVEKERLAKLEKTMEGRIDWLKTYYKTNMELMGKDKIQTHKGALAIQNNSRGAVAIVDPDQIPAAYMDIIPEQKVPNKDRIYIAFKCGKEVPGATYTVGKHLRVR